MLFIRGGVFMQDTRIGEVIYTIVASDADIGDNGDIHFTLQTPVSNVVLTYVFGV